VYDEVILQADPKTLRVIANVQYFYECLDRAKVEQEKLKENQQFYHAGPDDNDKTKFHMDINDAREIGDLQVLGYFFG
jgi:hypothetical protein